jgi:hypothetical protein
MEHYLAELYLSRLRGCDLAAAAARLEAASKTGKARFVRSIFVPEDETCFYLFEAESAEAVACVGGRAELPFERVVEAMTMGRRHDDEAR